MSLMPLASSSVHGKVGGYLKIAAQSAALHKNDPDVSVPYETLKDQKWTTHSLRRMSDSAAVQYAEDHGIPDKKVDARLGWKEAERRADMKQHYDEASIARRLESYLLTSEI